MLAEICVHISLKLFKLTRDEVILAKVTLEITKAAFSKMFGNIEKKEWPTG
jgi:hypothetical protein